MTKTPSKKLLDDDHKVSQIVAAYNEHMKPQVEAVFADNGKGRAEDLHFWDGVQENTATLNNDIETLSGELRRMKVAMRHPAVRQLLDGQEIQLSLTLGESHVWMVGRAEKKKEAAGGIKVVVHADSPLNVYLSQSTKYPDKDQYAWRAEGRTDHTFRLLPKDGRLRAGHLYISVTCCGKAASYKLSGIKIETGEDLGKRSRRKAGKNGQQSELHGALEHKLEVRKNWVLEFPQPPTHPPTPTHNEDD
jgi:hypothetical protein